VRLLDEDRFGQFQVAGGKLRVFLAQTRQGGLQACRNELPLAGTKPAASSRASAISLLSKGALVSWLLT